MGNSRAAVTAVAAGVAGRGDSTGRTDGAWRQPAAARAQAMTASHRAVTLMPTSVQVRVDLDVRFAASASRASPDRRRPSISSARGASRLSWPILTRLSSSDEVILRADQEDLGLGGNSRDE